MKTISFILIGSLLILNASKTVNNDLELSQIPTSNLYLEQMVAILDKAAPKYKEEYESKGFFVKDGVPYNFFVYNLVDTINNSYIERRAVQISDEGIYHFAPIRYRFSYSHIAVIHNGEMKVFGFLNCDNRGNSIEEVVKYVRSNCSYEEDVINRILNYRRNGFYFRTDPQSRVECE
jgi:hypothetical protein